MVITLIITGKQGWAAIQKIRHAKRLKFGVETVDFPKLNLSSLLSSIETNVELLIKNFSRSTFNIEQIGIEVLSPSGKIVAEQKQPLSESFEIAPNRNNLLPLSFLISSQNLKLLISESEGIANVGAFFIIKHSLGHEWLLLVLARRQASG